MSTNASLNGDKKRKQDCILDNEDQPDVKSVKLSEVNNSTEGAEPDGSESDSGSSSQEESLSGVPTSTPGTKSLSLAPLISSPASRNQDGGIPAPLPSTNKQQGLPQPGIPPQQSTLILDLRRGNAFGKMQTAFSTGCLPHKITYYGSSFNLHKGIDKYWTTFYSSTDYSKGRRYKKLPNDQLRDEELLAIAKILRRGWEDEHYFPREIHEVFLEACIFNRKELKDAMSLSVGWNTIHLWTRELVGLLELEEFRFLMSRRKIEDDMELVDVKRGTAPHQRWSTFHYGSSPKEIEYYVRMLGNDPLYSECHLCGDEDFDAQHFLGKCEESKPTMQTERHDCVVRMIHRELESAIERRVPYFGEGSQWKTIVMYGNLRYEWPKELRMLRHFEKYPHIIAYSVFPKKKALIIEFSVAWEAWLERRKKEKIKAYACLTGKLEKSGFEVQFEAIVFGSRGVPTEDVYTLFDQVFAMKHSKISRAMEEISKKVVSVPYQDYEELMEMVVF